MSQPEGPAGLAPQGPFESCGLSPLGRLPRVQWPLTSEGLRVEDGQGLRAPQGQIGPNNLATQRAARPSQPGALACGRPQP